jgi:outer membrane protein assembly factor BamB
LELNYRIISVKFSTFNVGVVSEYKISASPSVAGDKIFLTTNNSKFYVISSTGGILKEFDLTSPSYSSPAISDGYLVVSEYLGIVRAFKASEYLYIDIPYDEIISSSLYDISQRKNFWGKFL